MMENEDFRRGAIDIQWLEKHLAALTGAPPPADGVICAAIAAALLAERDRAAPRRSTAATALASSPDGIEQSAWLRVARVEGLR
jgi:hypothetical protein